MSCHTSKVTSERTERANARRSPQGIPERIAKGCNAAVARSVRSRRARPPWPVAALRPLAMRGTIPCGSRLATDQGGRADATLLV